MFNEAIATEIEESNPEKLEGKYPPFMHIIPPTMIIPETAFVTDIRGECKAGLTPQTT
jgi:hypothetical protein